MTHRIMKMMASYVSAVYGLMLMRWIWKAHCLKSIMFRAKKSQTTSKRGLGATSSTSKWRAYSPLFFLIAFLDYCDINLATTPWERRSPAVRRKGV